MANMTRAYVSDIFGEFDGVMCPYKYTVCNLNGHEGRKNGERNRAISRNIVYKSINFVEKHV